jgi:hypothetical protein
MIFFEFALSLVLRYFRNFTTMVWFLKCRIWFETGFRSSSQIHNVLKITWFDTCIPEKYLHLIRRKKQRVKYKNILLRIIFWSMFILIWSLFSNIRTIAWKFLSVFIHKKLTDPRACALSHGIVLVSHPSPNYFGNAS